VSIELARLVRGMVDCFLDSCGLPLGGRGLRFVGVAADQPLLSGCGLTGPIRGMHQNHLSLLLSCVELAPLVSDTVDRMLEYRSRLVGVAANQSPLSGCGLNGPIRGLHQNVSFSTTVVCDELARAVSGTVVVRVADRRHAAVGNALDMTIHLERARHFADHSPTSLLFPLYS